MRSAAISATVVDAPPAELDRGASAKPKRSSRELYRHVPVQDAGARAATNTFVQRGIGDVLLAWENEALLATQEMGADAFDIVMPSVSVLAEPPVALVDAVVDRKGTRGVAEAYLEYLYSPEGQDIVGAQLLPAARCRGRGEATPRSSRRCRLFTVDDVFGGWREAQTKHFNDGGIYDRIFSAEASAIRDDRRVDLDRRGRRR